MQARADMVSPVDHQAVISAMEANYLAAYRALLAGPRTHDFEEQGLHSWITGVPAALFNVVVQTQELGPADGPGAERVLRRFTERGVPLDWIILPSALSVSGWSPERLGLGLESRTPGMAADLGALPDNLGAVPPGVTLVPVDSLALLGAWLKVVIGGFEMPELLLTDPHLRTLIAAQDLAPAAPLRHLLAVREGVPLAATSYLLAAGVAGLYAVATLPQGRRQGLATTLVAAALRKARDQGCRVAVLQASPMGQPVYTRLGFRECCTFLTYGQPEGAPPVQ